MTEKEALRVQMKEARAALLPRREEASEAVCRALLALPEFQNASAVLLYAALPHELSLRAVDNACRALHRKTLYPRSMKKGEMAFFLATEDELVSGAYGIREPNEASLKITEFLPDALCIVPGLCFDTDNNRLGYGGGYYDRFLAAHPMRTVGVCYRELLLPSLPVEPTDIPVDRVLFG